MPQIGVSKSPSLFFGHGSQPGGAETATIMNSNQR